MPAALQAAAAVGAAAAQAATQLVNFIKQPLISPHRAVLLQYWLQLLFLPYSWEKNPHTLANDPTVSKLK
jgi:hypothetical protein